MPLPSANPAAPARPRISSMISSNSVSSNQTRCPHGLRASGRVLILILVRLGSLLQVLEQPARVARAPRALNHGAEHCARLGHLADHLLDLRVHPCVEPRQGLVGRAGRRQFLGDLLQQIAAWPPPVVLDVGLMRRRYSDALREFPKSETRLGAQPGDLASQGYFRI